MHVHVTKHAKKRMKQRLGIPMKSTLKVATSAYEEGMRIEDAKGKLKEFINTRSERRINGSGGPEMVIYNENIFIFSGNILITVYPIQGSYLRKLYNSIVK